MGRYVASAARTKLPCLGLRKPAHFICTTNPANRICRSCRRLQDASRVSPLVHEAVRVAGDKPAEY